MGLFGGFKAKFTKDSTAKSASKKSKKDEVVCLGYRVFSEFQDPPSYVQHQRKPSAIKTVLPRPESSKTGTTTVPTPRAVETRIITNPGITKSSFKQTVNNSQPSVTKASSYIDNHELITSRTSNTTGNFTKDNKDNDLHINKNSILLNANKHASESNTGELRHDNKANGLTGSAPDSMKLEEKIDSFNTTSSKATKYEAQNQTAPKSILKSKSLQELNESNNYIVQYSSSDSEDEEYNKHLTISSVNIKKSDETETKSLNYLTATQTVSGSHTTQVTTMVHLEDTTSGKPGKVHAANSSDSDYSYGQSNRSIGATSNHAASIFFDGDDEPEVRRQRRINLNSVQDEDGARSSAEC